MASPFRVFRKNVKPMLAFFVVMLMLSWVIGDSLFTYFAGNRNPSASTRQNAKAVAVSWDGGKLTNLQLNEMVARRQILNSFLEQVEGMGAQSALQAGVEPRPLRVERMLGPTTPQQGVEKSVVYTRLYADRARAVGMRVSNEAIVQYLDELGRNNVTRNQMRDMLSRLQGGRGGFTIDDIMATLRDEMLTRNYIASNQYAFETVVPEQRWQDWLRANDRVIVEAAAIPIEKYVAQVKDPSEADLTAFFDKYKDREASPELVGSTELPSATPGFKIPRKIDLQFIEANYESFLAKAEEKVTPDEISKFYEARKDPMFVKTDTGVMEDNSAKKKEAEGKSSPAPDAKVKDEQKKPDAGKPADNNPPAKPEGEKKADEKKPADAPSAPPKEEPKKEAAPPADASKKDATPPADAPKVDAPKKEEAPAPPAEPPKADGKPASGKQSNDENAKSKRVFHLVAFDDAAKGAAPTGDTKGAAATEKPAAATPETTAPPAPPTPPPAPPAPPAAPPETAKENPSAAAAPPAAASTSAAPANKAAAPKKPVEFQPLDEVKDVIRREIASTKVSEEVKKLTTDIDGELENDFQRWFGERLTALDEKKEPPAPPKSLTDLAPIAEKSGLKSGKTGPVSVLQLRDMPIGKSSVADTGRTILAQMFATKEQELYEPVITVDLDGNHYVVMKTSDTPSRVPTLAEVRDKVVAAWKWQEAVKLAQKAADELAKKAQEEKKPLPEFFAANDPSIKVVSTDPFSEITGGDVGFANGQMQPTPFRMGQPDGIVAAGPELLKKAFELKSGEVGVALNHDHTLAYVLRVVEHQKPINELRQAYLSEVNTWPGNIIMTRGHMQDASSSLQEDVVAGAKLKWEREADKVEKADSSDSGS